MEASRSLSAFFPAAQTQFTLQCSQRALRKQREMREKEMRLQLQLELICQRQHDAHRRNQDLLRDFRRLEEELSLLASRTDSFRRKRENYKKQLYKFISAPSQFDGHNNATTTADHSYAMQFYNVPEASGVYEPCHISASTSHVIHAPAQAPLCPNQHLRIKQVHQVDPPSCIAVYTQTSPISGSMAYLSSVSPPARDDDHKRGSSELESTVTKSAHIKLQCEETVLKAAEGQNIGKHTSPKELGYIAQSIVENHETPISFKSSNVPQTFTGITELKENYPMPDQSEQLKTKGTPEDKNVSEERIVPPEQKLPCQEVDLNEQRKKRGLGFFSTALKKSLEEFRKSDEEATIVSKASEDDNSSKCVASEYESGQENAVISLGLPLKEKDDTSSSINSDSEKGWQRKARKPYKTRTLQDSASFVGTSLVAKKDKQEELLNLDISESEVSDSEMQEREGEGKNMEILGENSRLTPSNSADIKITEDREREDIERERFSEMLLREIEVDSSDDERECEGEIGAESSSHEVIGVVIAKKRNIEEKVNTNEEGDSDNTSHERGSISEEGEISGDDDQASHLISKAGGVREGSGEGKINIEPNKENKVAIKKPDKNESNTGSESGTVTEEGPPNDADRSEDKRSVCEDTDVSDELDSSEENTDFYGRECQDPNLVMMKMNVQRLSSNQEHSPEEVNSDVSSRDDESLHSPEPHMSSVSSQNAIEEEDEDRHRKDVKLHSSKSDIAAFSSQEETEDEEEEDTHRQREVERLSSPEPDVVSFSSQDVTEEDDTEDQREQVRRHSPESDVVSFTSQKVIEDEEEARDRQREQDRSISPEPERAAISSPHEVAEEVEDTENQREKEAKCTRFREDGYLDMLQMHPVESSCMVPVE